MVHMLYETEILLHDPFLKSLREVGENLHRDSEYENINSVIIISNSSQPPSRRSCYIKATTSCCSNDQLHWNCTGMAATLDQNADWRI